MSNGQRWLMPPYPKPDPPVRLNPKARVRLRRETWTKQKGRCADCGKVVELSGTSLFSLAHLHHIKSRGAGGSDTPENVQILCPKCHVNYHQLKQVACS